MWSIILSHIHTPYKVLSMLDEEAIDQATRQAESILKTSIFAIDRRFGHEGYAIKNPGIVSSFISLQNTLLQAEIKRKTS